MEHWQKIVIGVVSGSVFIGILFYIFDKFLQTYRSRSPPAQSPGYLPLGTFKSRRRRHKNGQSLSPNELERLVYEEFKSENHELICVVGHNVQSCVGICAFLNGMKVEYFRSNFMPCCLEHCNDLPLRGVMCAISRWSEDWTGAELVNLLIPNKSLVTAFNTKGSREQELLKKFEEKFSFSANVHWTENYFCQEVDFEELWEEMTILLRKFLANTEDLDDEESWNSFPLAHWDRKRKALEETDLHQIPHAGDFSSSDTKENEQLIDL